MSRAVGLRSEASGAGIDRPGGDAASAAVLRQVDDEVGRLIDDAHARADAIVTDHRVHLDRLADRLVAAETLNKDEIDRLLGDVPRQPSGTQVDGPQAIGARRRRQPKARVLDAAHMLSGSR